MPWKSEFSIIQGYELVEGKRVPSHKNTHAKICAIKNEYAKLVTNKLTFDYFPLSIIKTFTI
jgi:hypothetical protein